MPAQITILLVDDNAIQASIRQVILRRSGYCVIAVLNPERALEQLRNGDFHSDIQLVITDHIMPDMRGTEFVRQIRHSHPKLPVLVISGMEEAEQEYAALNVEFRVKPLLPERLLESVRNLVMEGPDEDLHDVVSAVPLASSGR